MIVSVREIHDGRDATRQVKTGRGVWRGVGEYTRVFRVWTSTAYDEGQKVLLDMRIPTVGSPYPWNMNSYCQRQEAKQQSQSKRLWIVLCHYSSEFELSENPLNDPMRWVWRTEDVERPAVIDVNDNPIALPTGERFYPPPKVNRPRVVVVGQKNILSIPTWFMNEYAGSVNDASLTIDGVSVEVGMAQLRSWELSEWQERNDVWYRVLTLNIAFEFNWKDHQLRLPVLGMKCRSKQDPNIITDCVDAKHGQPVRHPVPLDENGYQLFATDPSQIRLITYTVFPPKDWSQLPLV